MTFIASKIETKQLKRDGGIQKTTIHIKNKLELRASESNTSDSIPQQI